MTPDSLTTSIEEVVEASAALSEALHGVTAALEDARAHCLTDGASTETVEHLLDIGHGRMARLRACDAIGRYQHAVMRLRAFAIREMVDEQGMSLSAVAARLGVSRPLVARLYRSDA